MSRAGFVFALFTVGCAAVSRPLPIDGGGGEIDLAHSGDDGGDGGGGGGDLARVRDLAAGPDLAGSDGGGCGVAAVVVNEVQTGGAAASDEWVELYNPCANPVNMNGAKVTYRSATNTASADTNTIANLTQTISAGGYLLIANSGYTGGATPDVTPFVGTGLAAAGGAVGLRDAAGKLVDSVGWGTANNPFVEAAAVTAPAASSSAARMPNGNDTNHNNSDFKVTASPTPRAAN
jgi:hypothetical protein